MPTIATHDGVNLYYEETGEGDPVVFVHEFGGDHRSWEPQVRFFSRRYRCITFNARGYPPSAVPSAADAYSQANAAADIVALLDGLGIARAHVVGLSMGGFATLHFGLTAPGRARSLVVAGAGYGAEKQSADSFRDASLATAQQFERQGAEIFGRIYALSPSRIPFLVKDPGGWERFATQLCEHSSTGSAMTLRGVQSARPSLYDLEAQLRELAVPTLIIVGDEDDHCLQPGIFLKKTIPASGLLVMPKTGHTLNLEEPAEFNRALGEFFVAVEHGRWLTRDVRSAATEIMKTS
jgi:pimeloyl-ACP methyl ester carboxylesterase